MQVPLATGYDSTGEVTITTEDVAAGVLEDSCGISGRGPPARAFDKCVDCGHCSDHCATRVYHL